ncbi:hypothetical protein D7B12_17860 [Salmonella enterica]|nr:hypothetical protein [Salmonella enterica]
MILPDASGNALRLFFKPPSDAVYWHVLRNTSPDFTSAPIVYTGTDEAIVDVQGLLNETKYFYQVEYRLQDGRLITGGTNHGTPASKYEDYTTDVLELLRLRLEAGLMEEVKRGHLYSELGYIQVLAAPPSMQNNLTFPLVTLLLENESPSERSIGDLIDDEGFDEEAHEWIEQAGWMADVTVSITGWSLNPTERIDLRKAIRRIIVANFTVLAAHGILLPNLSLTDADAVSGEFDAPLYLVNGDFTCQAPVRVGLRSDASVIDVLTEVSHG